MRAPDYRISPEPRPDGLRRIAGSHSYPSPFDLLTEAAALLEDPSGFNSANILREASSALKDLLIGDRRPCDKYLEAWPLHTDVTESRLRSKGYTQLLPNRLVVDATLTQRGNLSVRFRQSYLAEDGRWAPAPEWRLAYLGSSRIMERPDDELLFAREVEHLLGNRLAETSDLRRGREAQRREISLACRIVHAAFWLEVRRISQRFDVQVGTYLALLSTEQYGGEAVGLELVDGLAEHRGRFARFVETFEATHGHAPAALWAECEAARAGPNPYRFDAVVSRNLRTRTGPAATLTPGAVRLAWERLQEAERYGLFQPERVCDVPPSAPRGAPVPDTTSTPPEPTPAAVAPQPPPAPAPRVAEAKPVRPRSPRQPREPKTERRPVPPSLYRPAATEGGPRYPEKATFLKDDEKAEFGVETAHELVAMLNEAWARLGRRPLAQGSFPTSRVMLRTVVLFMRDARRQTAE